MKIFFLLLALASEPSLAQTIKLPPGSPRAENGAADMKVFEEFHHRLQTAIQVRDFSAIQRLYQTNGVAENTMKVELGRWKQLLDENTNQVPGMFMKDFAMLPPESHRWWTERVNRLTDHEVTHVCALIFDGPAVQMELPLIMVDGRFWIVPSEKRNSWTAEAPTNILHQLK